MMKVNDFLKTAAWIADELATIYVMGGHGHSLTWNDTLNEIIRDYSYNQKHEAEIREKYKALKSEHPFGFDCCGLIKGIIWGFNGDWTQYGGGTKYESNGLKDGNQDGLLENYGYEVSTDFTFITPGEMLYMKGHCGIYMGDGKVIECTPKWKNEVQWTEITQRAWSKHCKLSVIDYSKEQEEHEKPVGAEGLECPYCGRKVKLVLAKDE